MTKGEKFKTMRRIQLRRGQKNYKKIRVKRDPGVILCRGNHLYPSKSLE